MSGSIWVGNEDYDKVGKLRFRITRLVQVLSPTWYSWIATTEEGTALLVVYTWDSLVVFQAGKGEVLRIGVNQLLLTDEMLFLTGLGLSQYGYSLKDCRFSPDPRENGVDVRLDMPAIPDTEVVKEFLFCGDGYAWIVEDITTGKCRFVVEEPHKD